MIKTKALIGPWPKLPDNCTLLSPPSTTTLARRHATPHDRSLPPPSTTHHDRFAMSSPRALIALARSRPAHAFVARSAFSTSARVQRVAGGSAEGAPPDGFRIAPPAKWNENKESVWDQAGKYFLLTEMARGMYVLLEQFFRPP